MRILRWLLCLVPASRRADYSDAIEETLARRLQDTGQHDGRRRARIWWREAGGLVAYVVHERWADARERRRRRTRDSLGKAGPMDGLLLELRQSARRLRRSPLFTAAAVLTLALAIAANVAIFAVVERVVLNPLPYPASNRLLKLAHRQPGLYNGVFEAIPPGIYYHYLERSRTLASGGAYQTIDMTLTGVGEPERIRVVSVTPSVMPTLGVAPALGRWFTDAEGLPGAPRVAILSHGLWQRRYGGDPAIVGRTIFLDSTPVEIVGVMPPAFAFPDARASAWRADQLTRAAGFGLFSHSVVARLRDSASVRDVTVELTNLIQDLPQVYPESPLAVSLARDNLMATPMTLKTATVGNVTRALWILFASVGLVLLVACANVANLFLVRSESRQREVAVRRALGAGGRGVARFFLTESFWLAAAGGAIGLALAWGALRLLVTFAPATLPRVDEIHLDGTAVSFAIVLSAIAALAFGSIPLLHDAPLAATLHEGGRANTASRQRHRTRHLLMAGQVAMALVLLVASGLMIRSFQKIRAIDLGFEPASALTFRIGLPAKTYETRQAAVAAHESILEALKAIPGVSSASASTCLPLSGLCFGNSAIVERRPDEERQRVRAVSMWQAVGGHFFETVGMRVVRGRALTQDDVDRQSPNVVIDQTAADTYFAQEDPIGRRIASSRPPTLPRPAFLTIVGVVANTPTLGLAELHPMPKVYMPMSIAGGPEIAPGLLVGPSTLDMNYIVRAPVPPLTLTSAVRHIVDGVDKDLAIADVRPLQDLVDRAAAQMAFTMVLLAIAASVALLLGVIGIYGVMAYIVSQRTGEIGVRLALGAEPGSVAAAILRQGGLVTAVGLAAGLAIAYAGSRLMTALLYDISPRDPGVFAATTIVLLAVALMACWLPARRAARLSPLDALRGE